MRKLLHKLFGFEYCILIDNDGEINIRRIKKLTEEILVCYRFGLVRLYDDGTTSKSYSRWEKMVFK